MSLLFTTADAQNACTNSRVVTASGYSSTGAEGDTALQQSLAQALAAAITQVNGTLVRQQTSIETTITTRLQDEAYTEDTLDEYRETIEQTTAGFITGFEILRESQEHGLTRVDVLATVCTDPRVAISFRGDRTATGSIEATLLPYLQAGGWRVTASGSHVPLRTVTQAFSETGATLLLDITAESVAEDDYRGLRRVELEVAGNLTDLRSEERSQAYALTVEGVGTTREAALQNAGQNAALELARIFQATWALSGGVNPSGLDLNFEATRETTIITFYGATRANTRYEIEALLERTPGIAVDGQLRWDEAAQTLIVEATFTGDVCDITEELESARRILLRTESCTVQAVDIRIQRE